MHAEIAIFSPRSAGRGSRRHRFRRQVSQKILESRSVVLDPVGTEPIACSRLAREIKAPSMARTQPTAYK